MDRLNEVHEAQTTNLKRKQAFMLVAMFIVFFLMMNTALASVTPDKHVEDYDSDDYV